MNEDNIVIKGSFYSLTRIFMITIFSAAVSIFLFYKLIFPDVQTDSNKYEELIFATIGFVGLTFLFYWILASYYYYYELRNDRIIVRNMLKPYLKELPCSTLQYINLYGDLARSKTSTDNSLEFINQPSDSRKNFRYHSANYDQDDWKLLLIKFKQMKIRIEDPNKSFFKNSDIKFDNLVE